MKRPTYEELTAIARGAVDAVELANPGFAVVVIVQEAPVDGCDRLRTAAQGNVVPEDGASLCHFAGDAWVKGERV